MDVDLLEEVLSCPTLPSLPAIAMQVIELTSDPDVSMDELAALIEQDQALAAKVLRTVNSSFYSLRERCTTIKKALVLLGLSPVKTLTLGFSLVSSVDMERSPNFDWIGYWRRGLFTAVGAKAFAETARLPIADEAFLAGLLQDIGMVALYEALGDRYAQLIEETNGDHSKLVKLELSALELQHPEIGAMLGQRWRLPAQLTAPIKFHERPTASPLECADISRCVALGNLAHDALTDEDPGPAIRRLYKRCEQWYKIGSDDCQEAFKRVSAGTEEMSKLFNLETGEFKDMESLVEKAETSLVEMGKAGDRESFTVRSLDELLIGTPDTDPLTGALSRSSFDETLSKSLAVMGEQKRPVTLAQIVVEGLDALTEQRGAVVADEVTLSIVSILYKHFEPMGGVVCRLGRAIFSVILPGTACGEVSRIAETTRIDAERVMSKDFGGRASLAIGLASSEDPALAGDTSGKKLLAAATRAAQTARTDGGNCVRSYHHTPKAAA